jgi:hypothetical protein
VFNRYRREGMALKRIRPQEHFGLTDLARLVVSHVALDLRAALRQGEFRRSWSDVLWFRWMQFWGTYRGFATAGPLTGQLKRAFYYPSRHAAPTPAVPARRQPLNYALLARQEPAAGAARKAPIRRAGVRR